GVPYGTGQLDSNRLLAIDQRDDAAKLRGIQGHDSAFGLPGIWIERDQAKETEEVAYSVVDPETVMLTDDVETMKLEAATLLTRGVTAQLLDQLRERQPGLVEELIPNVLTVSDVQRVLQNLLQERVSIANINLIVETLVDIARNERDPGELTERL